MRVRTLASTLAPLLIFALAGSVFAAGGISRRKARHRYSPPIDDAEAQAPESEKKSAEGQREGVTAKASIETSGYADTDYVYVGSPSFGASISDEVAGWSFGGHYLVDVVSAASVDIVSTASNHWVEYRNVGSLDGSLKLGDTSLSASGNISSEPDYLSTTGSANLTLDLLEKNVTPFLGLAYTKDKVGRTGLPHELWKDKDTVSGRLGVTFTIDRETIASVQVDAISESGYLAKPYRYVPLFAPDHGASIRPGTSIDRVNAERVDERPIEQLPEKHNRFALTGRFAHRYSSSTIRLDERFYSDTWGIKASTSEFRFVFDIGQRWELWPHLRFHYQNGASFWRRAYELVEGPNGTLKVPEIRTGDRELSPLYTATVGFGSRVEIFDDWYLLLETDFGFTRYSDALYISDRRAIFSTLGVEAEF